MSNTHPIQAQIQIRPNRVGEATIQTVNARDLHAFLEVGKDFSTWVKNRIEQYGFVEHHDYVTAQDLTSPVLGSSKARPQRTIVYHLSLDMAKELSMVERNARGKQARQYFIECERRAKAGDKVGDGASDLAVLSDPAKLRSLLLTYAERVLVLEDRVQQQAPAVEFHAAVSSAINCQTIQDVSKVLGVGANRMFQFLRNEKLLMSNNLPYQKYLDSGYFRVVEKSYKDGNGERITYTRTLVTGKGLIHIQDRLRRPVGLFAN